MSSFFKIGTDYTLNDVGGLMEKEFDDIDNYDFVLHTTSTPTTPPDILFIFQMKVNNERRYITECCLYDDFPTALKVVIEYRKLFIRKLKIESILENG